MHGPFKLGEAALREGVGRRPNRQRNFNPKHGFGAIFAIIGQNDRISNVTALA